MHAFMHALLRAFMQICVYEVHACMYAMNARMHLRLWGVMCCGLVCCGVVGRNVVVRVVT